MHEQIAAAKTELDKPFSFEESLMQKSARLAELNTLLDMEATSQEADAPEKQPVNANEEIPEYEP